MKLTIGKKELDIKFGYKPTLKARIISKVVKFDNINVKTKDNVKMMENLEDLLLFIPEFLLTGLQVNHEEYRYDYDTGEGKNKKLDEVFALIEEYSESEDADIISIYNGLEEEMLKNSFLKRIFQQEKEKLEEKSKKAEQKEN